MCRSARIVLRLVAGAACVLGPMLMVAGVHGPVRVSAALALICLAPGAALLSFLQRVGGALELGLVVVTSLALYVLGSELMLTLGGWSPELATCVLAAGCLPAIATGVYMEVRTRPPIRSEIGRRDRAV
jgi:hypothetical protein